MRPLGKFEGVAKVSFNPRTRKGCDIAGLLSLLRRKVSIHAPVKDATQRFITLAAHLCFNPRTRKGCDTHIKDI